MKNLYRSACSAASSTSEAAPWSGARRRSTPVRALIWHDTRHHRQSDRVVSCGALVGATPGTIHRRSAAEPHWREGFDVDDNVIESEEWTNLVLAFEGRSGSEGSWRVSLNVQNLFDEDPPIIPSSADTRFGAQSTDNTYDEWGGATSLASAWSSERS